MICLCEQRRFGRNCTDAQLSPLLADTKSTIFSCDGWQMSINPYPANIIYPGNVVVAYIHKHFRLIIEARYLNATSLSTYDFSTLHTNLPNILIEDKFIDLIEKNVSERWLSLPYM